MKAIIIDDEQHVRDAIRLLIHWEDYEISSPFEAASGSEAIEILRKESPDLIFLDMMMPGMHGTEILEWIYEHLPHSKTIVISGHDDFAYVRHHHPVWRRGLFTKTNRCRQATFYRKKNV